MNSSFWCPFTQPRGPYHSEALNLPVPAASAVNEVATGAGVGVEVVAGEVTAARTHLCLEHVVVSDSVVIVE